MTNWRMTKRLLALLCALLLSNCAWFDSRIEWRHGRYALLWVDLPDEVRLSFDVGDGAWGTIVEPRVFSVGANERYVVAKQHPGGNRSITNYYIVEIRTVAPSGDWKEGVTGPLTEQAFDEKAKTLGLPVFSRTLEALR